MQDLIFWRTWPRSYQLATGALVLLIFMVLVSFSVFYFIYPAPTLAWQHVQQQIVNEIPLRSITSGITELVVPVDNYIIFDQMLGDRPHVQVWAYLAFSIVFFLAISLFLAIVTTLSRFWYLAGMTLVIVLFSYLRIEILLLFGSSSKLSTIALIAVVISATAWFQFFKKEASFFGRCLLFTLLLCVGGLFIHFFAEAQAPFLHLAVAAIPPAIVLTVIFIVLVAHEILAALIAAITRGFGFTHSLRHFLVIAFVYLLNLSLAYAEKFNMIDWNFRYIDFFMLLIVSAVFGFWGFRQRQAQLESFLEDPFATLFYLGMAFVAFGTITLFWATANDSVLDALDTTSIYAHLGFGLVFCLYVLSNFGSLLERNMEVHKVLYKPTRMPYVTFRLGGLVALVSFLIYNGWQVPVLNATSGFYTAAGDIYRVTGDLKTALSYYQLGRTYGYQSHYSNYAAADIEGRFLNFKKERQYYLRANDRRPTEMAALNYAYTFQREDNFLEALLALRETTALQNRGSIQNTRGLLLKKLNVLDSAAYFLQRAAEDPVSEVAAKINLIGLVAEKKLPLAADSLLRLLESRDPGVQSNAFALANEQRQRITAQPALDLEKDTVFNLFTATLLHNYLINTAGELDTAFIARVVALAGRPANEEYDQLLRVGAATAYYECSEVEKALLNMEYVIFRSIDKGKHNLKLAVWALEQGAPDVATRYLAFATQQQFPPARIAQAVALSEIREIGPAIVAWDSLQRGADTVVAKLASKMVRVLASPPHFVSGFTDDEKYAYTRYRLGPADSVSLAATVANIRDPNYRARAWLDFSKKLYAQDALVPAIRAFQNIRGLTLTDENLYKEIQHVELTLLARQRAYRMLAEQINRGVVFEPRQTDRKLYFKALIELASGRRAEAEKIFNWLASANPFFAEGITAAAQFYQEQQNPRRAYTILAEALQRNPRSVMLLKAYAVAAAAQGFDQYAASALETLRTLLPAHVVDQFVLENQAIFTF